MVHRAGLEPACLSAPVPETGLSTIPTPVHVARSPGLEPGTRGLEIRCSIQLSKERMWRSESGSRREASPCGKRSSANLRRLLSGEVPYQLGYHSIWRRTEVSIPTASPLPTVFWTGVSAG